MSPHQLPEDERLSLVEQTALCHPAVHSVELSSDDGILGAVLPDVRVRLTVTAVAYKRRTTTLVVYK